MGQVEDLGRRQHLRRLAVVAADLGEALVDAVALPRALRLDDRDRDAVDQEHDVGPVRPLAVRVRPLVGDLEDVVGGVVEVDDRDVALAPLALHVDGPLPRSHASTSAFPSMVVRTPSIRPITPSTVSTVTTPGFSAISFSRRVG